jgi:2-amino-4-hydroxy-6-hydroxymethyldihydropteridine diphosphokinase
MGEESFHTVFLGLGSNLGDRGSNLARARMMLEENGCTTILASSIYETEAWGYRSKNMFYNQCLQIETLHSPSELLNLLKRIESAQGREFAVEGYADRPIDMDILFYNDLILETEDLQIPHPGIAERAFVLAPLAEIAPGKIHPVLGQPVSVLVEKVHDMDGVRRLDL